MSNTIIQFDQVSFMHKSHFQIRSASFQIVKGKITTLIGPNGCGKSTLLRLMMRLISPCAGKIYLKEKEMKTYSRKILSKEMTMLSQSPDNWIDIAVHDLVAYGRLPYKNWLSRLSEEDEEVINWALEVCHLQKLAYRPLHTLSGGERQRAWLGMALAQRTPILLLDEPTTYLDIAHQLELLDLLRSLNERYNLTIVLILHDLNQAASYSDHLIVCDDGKIIADGPPKQVFQAPLLEKVFHIQAKITESNEKILIDPVKSTRFFPS